MGLLEFLARIFGGRETDASKNIAKERLRLVLVHDRVGVSPNLMEMLKSDLIKIISKYMEIDENALEVILESNENQVALVANIPIRRLKRVKGLVSNI